MRVTVDGDLPQQRLPDLPETLATLSGVDLQFERVLGHGVPAPQRNASGLLRLRSPLAPRQSVPEAA